MRLDQRLTNKIDKLVGKTRWVKMEGKRKKKKKKKKKKTQTD